jgi:hypothetical protein
MRRDIIPAQAHRPLTNAEKQAAWRARQAEELRNLRIENWRLKKRLRNLQDGAKRRDFLASNERKLTAYHEAGHAVVGLALQLPIAYACAVAGSRQRMAHVAMERRSTLSIGHGYRIIDGRYKATVPAKARELDAFGNTPRKIERAPEEHRAEIVMCIAGPMAEAQLVGDAMKWREKASSADMSIARFHRGKLGELAKSWEQYERETAALVDRHWPMIEAVASRLMKVDWINGNEVDDICARVTRRQYAAARKACRPQN